LRLAETAPAAYLPTFSGFYKSDGSLRVSLSAVKVKAGEDFRIYVSGFPAGSLIDYRVSQFGETFSVAYEGNVDLEGNAGMTISIPSNANVGETWIIRVQTISEAKPVKILSPKIFIVGYMYADTKNTAAKVTLDRTQVKPGGTLKVSVSGFPINSHIDYRVGEYGKPYSLVYDGIVDAEGNASQIITIPLSAEKGKLWVVHVQTTSHVVGVDVTSATIKIIE
jgi:protein involved in polysaccharide export with SLBB domain